MRSGGVRCALNWGASSMYMYGHDRGAHAARSVEGAGVQIGEAGREEERTVNM